MKLKLSFLVLFSLLCQITGILACDGPLEREQRLTFNRTILAPNPPLSYMLLREHGMKDTQTQRFSLRDFKKLFSIKQEPGVVTLDSGKQRGCFCFTNEETGTTLQIYRDPKKDEIVQKLINSSKEGLQAQAESHDKDSQSSHSAKNETTDTLYTHTYMETEKFVYVLDLQKEKRRLQLKTIRKKNNKIKNALEIPYVGENLTSFPIVHIVEENELFDAKLGEMTSLLMLCEPKYDICSGIISHTGKMIKWFPNPRDEENAEQDSFVMLDNVLFYLRFSCHGRDAGKKVPVAFDLKSGKEISHKYKFDKIPPCTLLKIQLFKKDGKTHTRLTVRDLFHRQFLLGKGVFPETYTAETADALEISRFPNGELITKREKPPGSRISLYIDDKPKKEYKFPSTEEMRTKLLIPPFPTSEQYPILLNFYVTNPKDGLQIPTGLSISQGLKPGQKVPALIYLHGGPEYYVENDFSNDFYFTFARPCALFIPNIPAVQK